MLDMRHISPLPNRTSSNSLTTASRPSTAQHEDADIIKFNVGGLPMSLCPCAFLHRTCARLQAAAYAGHAGSSCTGVPCTESLGSPNNSELFKCAGVAACEACQHGQGSGCHERQNAAMVNGGTDRPLPSTKLRSGPELRPHPQAKKRIPCSRSMMPLSGGGRGLPYAEYVCRLVLPGAPVYILKDKVVRNAGPKPRGENTFGRSE